MAQQDNTVMLTHVARQVFPRENVIESAISCHERDYVIWSHKRDWHDQKAM